MRHSALAWLALCALAACSDSRSAKDTPDLRSSRARAAAAAVDCRDFGAHGAAARVAGPAASTTADDPFREPDSGAPDGGSAVRPQLSAGPIVGGATDTSAKLWVRADNLSRVRVRYWPLANPADERRAYGPPPDPDHDRTTAVDLQGLEPATRYGYAVDLAAVDGLPALDVVRGAFRTLPRAGQKGAIRFAVGADITGKHSQPIFDRVREQAPDFVLLIGDQVYADSAADYKGYRAMYRNNWNIAELHALLAEIPTAMIWDDHEIVEDYFAGKDPRYPDARRAYELYVHAHNPPAYRDGVLYYTFRARDVAFFVLDVRSFRSSPALPDGPDKTMLGAQQKADLFAWLRCEKAAVKVIVSPVIFSDWTRTGKDSWAGFRDEREEVLGFIAAERTDDVLMVSGDQHWSAIFRMKRGDYTFYEFLPTPLSKSRGTAPTEATDEIIARDDDQFVFGVVDIDTSAQPVSIALTLCRGDRPCRPGHEPAPGTALDVEGDQENVPFTVHLTSDDLGLSP